MSASQEQQPHNSSGGSYKRASRKGAPRRYACQFPNCDKVYSRQEHLQRHQLNHNPREIFICDADNCGQRFVRADLLARHKKRHSSSYTPRNRTQSFAEPKNEPFAPVSIASLSPSGGGQANGPANIATSNGVNDIPGDDTGGLQPASGNGARGPVSSPFSARPPPPPLPPFPHSGPNVPNVPHDAAILLTPESSTAVPATPLPGTTALAGGQSLRQSQAHAPAQDASVWSAAAAMSDMPDMIQTPKAGSYYPPHPQPQRPHNAPNSHHGQALRGTTPTVLSFANLQFSDAALARDNFAMWLFNTQANYDDFNVSQLPFLEGGLESPFNNNIHYDYESLTSHSRIDTPPRQLDNSEEPMTEFRRQELLRKFQHFRTLQPQAEPCIANLGRDSGGDIPALNLEMMHDCLYEYWEHVSPRVPIIHQPTFSCNLCPPLLVLVMISLGAASLHGRDATGNLAEFRAFADIIIMSARWEILTADEASPPVGLWVAQALLLLEFYEKMYSSRRLHERSHIYHSATLTLLRRGSPLIGRSGSESPPDDMPPSPSAATTSPSQPSKHPDHQHQQNVDWHSWWTRWAETEAMHRVVFAAFCFDVTHAAMFGHAADMAPHEIRLPLPCDDNLWTATKPDDVRQLDANFRMYGVKPIFFLDGLKRALHGKEVQTHSFGRMIIMSGLLSVGWHLSHRETHLKWLDLTTPSTEMQDGWRKILLGAFDNWKASFDMVQGPAGAAHSLPAGPAAVSMASDTLIARRGVSNGPIQSAAVLYHLAHISLHVDIIDCQVYAGARRLLGRKVSSRDYTNVVSRMKAWAKLASTRHAILHAFKLLHQVLVDLHAIEKKHHRLPGLGHVDLPPIETQTYSCRTESDPHRPWIMYYAALSIWAFVRAINDDSVRRLTKAQQTYGQLNSPSQEPPHHHYQQQDLRSPPHIPSRMQTHQASQHQQHTSHYLHQPPPHPSHFVLSSVSDYRRISAYLGRVAEMSELSESAAMTLSDGLVGLLDYLYNILAEAHSELLHEAHVRLKHCRDILLGVAV